MENLPAELLGSIIEHVGDDTSTIKNLRLPARSFEWPTARQLYRRLVFHDTSDSWRRLQAVIDHQHYGPLVKNVVSSIEDTPWEEECLGLFNSICYFAKPSSNLVFELHGSPHVFYTRSTQTGSLKNVTLSDVTNIKFEFALQLSRRVIEEQSPISRPQWLCGLKNVKHLSVLYSPALDAINCTITISYLLPYLAEAGCSGLVSLSLDCLICREKDLERFICQQAKTLKSLRIIEPVFLETQEDWSSLRNRIDKFAPNLENMECTEELDTTQEIVELRGIAIV
ncbi:MAG: hypothetical protein Q9169_002979 [Polycauliona sp. 2 TL-2023]